MAVRGRGDRNCTLKRNTSLAAGGRRHEFAAMKTTAFFSLTAAASLCSCVTTPRPASGTWESVQPVLERNCVHCHGAQRLAGMPAMTTSAVLAQFAKENRWIVPGSPEGSRFYQVVVLGDDQPGAMPPTGHAISNSDREILHAWIANRAPVPASSLPLQPQGEAPRSR